MRDRLARCAALACVMLPPLTLWLGFADNIETPKRIVLAGLALVLALATAASAAARDRLARAPLTGPGLGLAALYLLSARLCSFEDHETGLSSPRETCLAGSRGKANP